MESIDFESIPCTEFPTGSYLVLHHGVIPTDGFVLSQVKVVGGWPNTVLEASRHDGAPSQWLVTVDRLANSCESPQFNMGVYQVQGKNYPAAIYGPMEQAKPLQLILFKGHMEPLPEKFKHFAHVF